jgi:5-methylcytosine-specific restriction protein A
MSTYLYTWNPKRWKWVDQPEAICRIGDGEQYDMYWSCGNTKKIAVGDTFFLIKLGVEPKGIIGCGYVSSLPYPLPHWDEEKAKEGLTALRTDLLFKVLSEMPIISIEQLQARYPAYNWSPQVSGLSVPEPIASELFAQIQASPAFGFSIPSANEVRLYAEGKSKTITTKTYDRSPLARQACIEHYGHTCCVCGFNFEKAYGQLGANYLEVHHLKPVADIGEEYLIDPIKDLRPVCANCHRMLHKQRPPLSVEELLTHNPALQGTLRDKAAPRP